MSLFALCYARLHLLFGLLGWGHMLPETESTLSVKVDQQSFWVQQESPEKQEKTDTDRVVWDDPTVLRTPMHWRH